MNKNRLKILATYLKTVPPEEFCLFQWRCGSVACAIGHACSMPRFNKMGLTMVDDDPMYIDELGKKHLHWNAVRQFFDISEQQAFDLFKMTSYLYCPSGPKDVARKIEMAIATTRGQI